MKFINLLLSKNSKSKTLIRDEKPIKNLSEEEKQIIFTIKKQVGNQNFDNISRTQAYQKYYEENREVTWAYLASMVSRNAGWNITDLKGELLSVLISSSMQKDLFLTYETANWLIFFDAYSQLLLYEESKKRNKPYFHLLYYFDVSSFMEQEWTYFWKKGNIERLCTALIINEQHVIQKPVIEKHFFKKHVFQTSLFTIVDKLHFNTVIFPTLSGKLYGYSVHGFKQVKNRIKLGKRLAWLLQHSTKKQQIYEFSRSVSHTGSRYDYEQFVAQVKRKRNPILRESSTVVTHFFEARQDWYLLENKNRVAKYFQKIEQINEHEITSWYYRKQKQLYRIVKIKQQLKKLLENHRKE